MGAAALEDEVDGVLLERATGDPGDAGEGYVMRPLNGTLIQVGHCFSAMD